MRACFASAQLLDQAALEIGGNGVLELLRFVMHFVPLHTEDLGQHALDQVMPVQQALGDFVTLCGQRDLPFLAYPNQAIPLEPPDCHGDRGRRHVEPALQSGGDDCLPLRFGLGDRLEVVFLRNGDLHAIRL